MKLNGWWIFDIIYIIAGWIVIATGLLPGFDTIIFFEPGAVWFSMALSLITGMLIGIAYERIYQEKKLGVEL